MAIGIIIVKVRRVVDEIPTIHVIDITIAIIVNTIASNFVIIDPQSTGTTRCRRQENAMTFIKTRINNGDDDFARGRK
ncbi:hypothetical protein D3C87_1380870 [compost metagenome]